MGPSDGVTIKGAKDRVSDNSGGAGSQVGDVIEAAVDHFMTMGPSGLVEPVETPLFRVVLYTDIVDSTKINVSLGDQRFVAMMRAHDAIVRRRLREFEGEEYKHTGDGFAATFIRSHQAIAFSERLHDDLDHVDPVDGDRRLTVRIGMSAGMVLPEGGDFFGLCVIRAVRLCAAAGPGETLADAEVLAGLDRPDHEYPLIGDIELKGLPGRTTVYGIRKAGSNEDELG